MPASGLSWFFICWAEYICHLKRDSGWKVRVMLRMGVVELIGM